MEKFADKTKAAITEGVERILIDFARRLKHMDGWVGKAPEGCAGKWVTIFSSDYPEKSVYPALMKIRGSGYRVYRYTEAGRDGKPETLYRITPEFLMPMTGGTPVR